MRLPVLFAVAALLAASAAQAQQVYVWKDAKGVTHYTDAPPPKGRYATRSATSRTPTPTPAKTSKIATTPAERCETAKRNLQLLSEAGNSGMGLDADGDGQPDAPMSAEERERQIGIAQVNIRAHCAGKP